MRGRKLVSILALGFFISPFVRANPFFFSTIGKNTTAPNFTDGFETWSGSPSRPVGWTAGTNQCTPVSQTTSATYVTEGSSAILFNTFSGDSPACALVQSIDLTGYTSMKFDVKFIGTCSSGGVHDVEIQIGGVSVAFITTAATNITVPISYTGVKTVVILDGNSLGGTSCSTTASIDNLRFQ
jgi:hypothetical protein